MARIHRKFFPALTPNETQGCADFCDPLCPYNCYTSPDFYLPPPPPPPRPPTSAADHFFSGNHISSYLIILGSLFAFVFVLVGIYVIKSKCYAVWCGWRDHFRQPSESASAEQDFLDDNRVDHPVWLITTVGLQQSIINSITVCKYRKGEGLIEGTECSVCLNELKEGETLRLLPKCNHAFHIPCIDTWLRSHTNCPLCRAGIVSNNVSPDAAMTALASVQQNTNSFERNHETQTENTRNNGELSNNILGRASGVAENRAATREARELTDDSIFKENSNVDHIVEEHNDQTRIDEIKQVTRSVSMDYYRLAGNISREHDSEPSTVNLLKQYGTESTVFKTTHRSSIGQCLHVSPVCMKRSFSCSGRISAARGSSI